MFSFDRAHTLMDEIMEVLSHEDCMDNQMGALVGAIGLVICKLDSSDQCRATEYYTSSLSNHIRKTSCH